MSKPGILVLGVVVTIGCAGRQSSVVESSPSGSEVTALSACKTGGLFKDIRAPGIDGQVVGYSTYTYDANGNQLSKETDYDGDGTIDSRTIHTYHRDGRCLSTAVDNNGDGTIDCRTTYPYDADGNQRLR